MQHHKVWQAAPPTAGPARSAFREAAQYKDGMMIMKTTYYGNLMIGLVLSLLCSFISGGCARSSSHVRISESLIRIAPLANKLAIDDTVYGQWFPAGTILYLNDDARSVKFCLFPHNTMFQGHLCNGSGPNGWTTSLYPDGKLASAGLARTEVIDGIPCARGTFWNEVFGAGSKIPGGRTFFYENGRLKYAKAAATIEYRGRIIKKGQHVQLKENGSIDYIK